ncbi:unnamed protein product [Tuwongella immobilis]|uniref:Uncharacterized protein n=1 Tax=Tuwongella immobilis TaxID=692036 RepID=A0A6C2YV97_9BACT|nr:unnamed protein product [Tuwongella immobilis]VTS08692.1 unnamed protein product [Tuwongella immobilis]
MTSVIPRSRSFYPPPIGSPPIPHPISRRSRQSSLAPPPVAPDGSSSRFPWPLRAFVLHARACKAFVVAAFAMPIHPRMRHRTGTQHPMRSAFRIDLPLETHHRQRTRTRLPNALPVDGWGILPGNPCWSFWGHYWATLGLFRGHSAIIPWMCDNPPGDASAGPCRVRSATRLPADREAESRCAVSRSHSRPCDPVAT